jgi:tryptophanyl-tRNA synthetase
MRDGEARMSKERVYSAMRPTGPLHLGHLAGALLNWATLQDDYDCIWGIADWHALMSETGNPQVIHDAIPEMVVDYIAAGLDPEKAIIARQSDVPEHIELFTVFACVTPVSWLERCPTYKEQLQQLDKTKDVRNYAFLGYPVLQAADIVVYKATVVPVGEDQLAHLELTREIVRKFNSVFGREVFPEPKAKLARVPKLLGLDGRKMSKSYGNAIGIGDEPEEIRKKVMTMLTDPKRPRRSDPGHPDECNLFPYYMIFDSGATEAVRRECVSAERGCVECKKQLAEALVAYTEPLREKRSKVLEDPDTIWDILSDGAKRAREVAGETMAEVREVIRL